MRAFRYRLISGEDVMLDRILRLGGRWFLATPMGIVASERRPSRRNGAVTRVSDDAGAFDLHFHQGFNAPLAEKIDVLPDQAKHRVTRTGPGWRTEVVLAEAAERSDDGYQYLGFGRVHVLARTDDGEAHAVFAVSSDQADAHPTLREQANRQDHIACAYNHALGVGVEVVAYRSGRRGKVDTRYVDYRGSPTASESRVITLRRLERLQHLFATGDTWTASSPMVVLDGERLTVGMRSGERVESRVELVGEDPAVDQACKALLRAGRTWRTLNKDK